MTIYLDNAATTPLDPEVLDAMMPYLAKHYGNPSSIHSLGRETRAAIEKSRKTIAQLLNTSPSEIFFTSGGTEADNTAIQCGIKCFNLKHAISSPIEHHAVLHTLEALQKKQTIDLSFVPLNSKGLFNLSELESLLQKNPQSFVSLMHGNNELGNLNDLEAIGELCERYQAIFHSDTVQTIAHYKHDQQQLKVDFIVGSAHKFHGPKGVGFLYVNNKRRIDPLLHGGAQERNMRGGTENVYAIVGMAKAMEIAYSKMDIHRSHIMKLKYKMIELLKAKIPGVVFNGNSENVSDTLYTVLNVGLPPSDDNDMLLFNLDIRKVMASGGSACSSGTDIGSHVLNFLKADSTRGHVRFSFSKYNTEEEVEKVVEVLQQIYR
ncbi:MAG TPA: cysteine desulfurase family protein [Cytophagaceae bacterium]|jgi:cysteine desulfurase